MTVFGNYQHVGMKYQYFLNKASYQVFENHSINELYLYFIQCPSSTWNYENINDVLTIVEDAEETNAEDEEWLVVDH